MRDIAGIEKTMCWSLVDEVDDTCGGFDMILLTSFEIATLNPLFEEILVLTTVGGGPNCEMF